MGIYDVSRKIGYSTVGLHVSEASRMQFFRHNPSHPRETSPLYCDYVIFDRISATNSPRPKLEELFADLKKDDFVYIYRLTDLGFGSNNIFDALDRLNRSKCAIEFLDNDSKNFYMCNRQGITFFKGLIEFERIQRSDTEEILSAVRRIGRAKPGRPSKVDHATLLLLAKEPVLPTARELMRRFGFGQTMAYAIIKDIKAQALN